MNPYPLPDQLHTLSQEDENALRKRDASDAMTRPKSKGRERRRKAPHELLTEAEKKANHIASEQKRRQNIRLGFDQLIDIVPSLTQGNRSEAIILQKCKSKCKENVDLNGIHSCGTYSTIDLRKK